MKKIFFLGLSVLTAVLLLATSCTEESVFAPELIAPESSGTYWHTRQLTPSQKGLLRRSFGLGFSYDAVNGGYCDLNAVRCQILNLDSLEDRSLLMVDKAVKNEIRTTVAHNFTEYCQVTNLTGEVSGDVCIYSYEYKHASSLLERGMDSLLCFHNERSFLLQRSYIQTRGLLNRIKASPETYLSPSFLYGLKKLKRSQANQVAVVDSFIRIYGTHVLVSAELGGKLILDMQTSKQLILDYASEQTVTQHQFDVIFNQKTTTITEEHQKLCRQIIDQSTLSLKVQGGNVGLFNSLVADPTYKNEDASPETLREWEKSLEQIDFNNPQDISTAELVDMQVIPIWELIPDDEIAKRVHARVLASVPTMEQLYGNRNWVNTKFNFNEDQVTTVFYPQNRPQQVTFDQPWVYNIIAANRTVATVCREWVPEIDRNNTVTVVYPVYNNHADLTLGLCCHAGKVYRVSWLYDRFVVKLDSEMPVSDGQVYLTNGILTTEPAEGYSHYETGRPLIAYEWPGSLNVSDGNTVSTGWLTVRKFLDKFYLENGNAYTNIPNWTYVSNSEPSVYYRELIQTLRPYQWSGLNPQSTSNRMVRDANYSYYINTNEAWYE